MKKTNDEKLDDELSDEDLEAFEDLEETGEPGAEEEDELEFPVLEEEGAEGDTEPENHASTAEPTELDPLDLASDVPVQIVAVMAKKNISVRELMNFRIGQVIDLNRPAAETIDLVANGKLVARGELVEIDGKLGVRIIKLVR